MKIGVKIAILLESKILRYISILYKEFLLAFDDWENKKKCLVAGKMERKQDSPYSTPNTAVDEIWVWTVLEYVPVTSVKLAVHFCDQSAMLQLHEKHKVIIQKAFRKWWLSDLFCNRGIFLMACGSYFSQKDEVQSQMWHAFSAQYGKEIRMTFSLIRWKRNISARRTPYSVHVFGQACLNTINRDFFQILSLLLCF